MGDDGSGGADPAEAGLVALRAALAEGPDAWIVGGAVRERLRGVPATDLDVAIAGEGTARATARAVARATGGHAFPLSDAFGAWRASAPPVDGRVAWQVDLTPLQGADLREDLARRDLTVNAMAEPVAGGPPIDPHGGREDLASGTLRMVGADAFAADPVRVLRLARFAAELDGAPEPGTVAAARNAAPRLADVPGERMLPELQRILASDRWTRGLRVAAEAGALGVLLPGALDAGRLPDATLALLESVLAEGATVPEAAAADRDALAARGGRDDRRTVLGLAALLVRTEDPGGAVDALRPSRRLRAAVVRAAGLPARLRDVRGEPVVGDRALFDAVRPLGADAPEAVLLARAVLGGDAAPWAALTARALRWVDRPPASPIRGDELATALGLPPGPALGALLEELAIAADAGRIATADEALALARELRAGSAS